MMKKILLVLLLMVSLVYPAVAVELALPGPALQGMPSLVEKCMLPENIAKYGSTGQCISENIQFKQEPIYHP